MLSLVCTFMKFQGATGRNTRNGNVKVQVHGGWESGYNFKASRQVFIEGWRLGFGIGWFPLKKKNIIDSELMVYNDCTMMITDGLMKV